MLFMIAFSVGLRSATLPVSARGDQARPAILRPQQLRRAAARPGALTRGEFEEAAVLAKNERRGGNG